MNLIPKELSSKKKITKNLHFADLLIVLGYAGAVIFIEKYIHSSLTYLYYGFFAIMGIFFFAKSKDNPDRYNLIATFYAITRDRKCYYSLDPAQKFERMEGK